MGNICFYYLPDFRKSGRGCCAYEGFQKMTLHPKISNRWILHPFQNPIDHPVAVDADNCRDGTACPGYSMEWRAR